MLRQIKHSFNVVVMIMIVAMIVLYVNYLGSRHYRRLDWTEKKYFQPSAQSIHILESLTEDVMIYVVLDPQGTLFPNVLSLVKEFQYYSPHIKVEMIDPVVNQARFQKILGLYNIDPQYMVVVSIGDKHHIVMPEDLALYDTRAVAMGGSAIMTHFYGEQAIISSVLEILEGEPIRILLSQGHGERDPDSKTREGLVTALKKLKALNCEIDSGTVLGGETLDVDSVDLVAIIGPTEPFTEQERTLLDEYYQRGGKLLVLLDPFENTELESFLKPYGVVVGDDVVIDPKKQIPVYGPEYLYVNTFDDAHPITAGMRNMATIFLLARSVDQDPNMSKDIRATRLALTSDKGWGEVTLDDSKFSFQAYQDKQGPVPVALAVQRSVADHDGREQRCVVIGNSKFVANDSIGNAGNARFLQNAVQWLVKREDRISLSPKETERAHLYMTETQMTGLFWKAVIGMPLVVFVIGAIVWFRRRG